MKPGPMRGLVLAALLVVLVITTTSAYIRLSQAGFGCADWPACYGHGAPIPAAGQLIPEASALFWARALHRLAASSAGILLLLIAFLGWKALQDAAGRLAALATVALAGLLAALGMVTPSNLPAVTIGNLLGGMWMAALLWWLYRRGSAAGTGAGRILLWVALAALALQIALGGMIGARHAVLACTGFPTCNGSWWPGPTDWRLFNPFFRAPLAADAAPALAPLAMAHRYGALLLAAILFPLGMASVRRESGPTACGWLLLVALGVQLSLGAAMVLANFPLPLGLLHNLGAVSLLGATIGLSGGASRGKGQT
jgi:heme a synthase